MGPQTSGALKAPCAQAVDALMPGGTRIVRPGLLVGPHDPTGRFTYRVRRVAAGGVEAAAAGELSHAVTRHAMSSVLWAAPMIAVATTVGLACRWFWRPAHPRLKRATLIAALDVYKTAWEQRDSKLILTIFTKDAIYHERVLQEPIRGHEGIAAYWQEKVLRGQDRISFTLLNTYIEGTTGIAEWEVYFDDCVQRKCNLQN